MLKTVIRLLLVAILVFGAWFLLRQDGAGWRWLVNGGWHTTARVGALSPEEQRWASVAWRYFDNNTQPQTGLVNGSDKRPVVSVWQLGDTLIALTAARQLGLVDDVTFDQRITRLLGTLNRLMLTGDSLPNLLYNTQSGAMIDYSNQPRVLGWSSREIARLMVGLRLVAAWHPEYAEYLERILLRWNFCRIVDKQGQLFAGEMQQNQQTITRPEGRLGDSEYSAAGFGEWGFANQLSLAPPAQPVIIYDLSLDVDDRDPRTT